MVDKPCYLCSLYFQFAHAMRIPPILGLFLLLPFFTSAQVEELDSLKQLLQFQKDVDRINTLLDLSFREYEFDIEAAHQYALEAYGLAKKSKNKSGEKHALSLIGEYYYNLEDHKTARKYFKQSAGIKTGEDTRTGYNYTLFANIYWEEADMDSARVYFNRALPLIKIEENYEIWNYSYGCWGLFLAEMQQLPEARKVLEEVYSVAVQRHARTNQAEALVDLAQIENLADEYQKSKAYLLQANPFLPGPGYSYLRLVYYYQIGYVEYNMGNYFTAITHLREVLSTKEVEQYDDIKANINALVGKIYVKRGEFDLALKSYLEAVKIMERLGMRRELGRTYSDIAWLYFKQYNDPETAAFANKSRELCAEIRDDIGLSHAHSVLGSLYTAQGKYEAALQQHQKSLAIRKRIQSRRGIADSHYNLGTTYEKMGQIDQALNYAFQSLAVDQKLGNTLNLGLSYKKIAALDLLKGRYDDAKWFLLKADSCAKRTHSLELRRDVQLLYAEMFEKTGDIKKANQYLRDAISSNDSFYTVLNVEKNAEIRGLFDLENIELKSRQREQELALQRIEMEGEHKYYMLLNIILLLVTLLLVIGTFLYNSIRISNSKLIAEIAERKKAETGMLESQVQFEEAQALAHVGSWEYSLKDGTLNWSKETYRIFELEQCPKENLHEAWRQKCHPLDVVKLDDAIQRTIATGEPFAVEHRVLCQHGAVKYVNCIGEAIKDTFGNITGLRGTDQEVTLQKQATLAKSEFLSSMSHEIRTPINGVIGISNLLYEENLTDIQREYVQTLKFSAQHLSSILSDILDFSKIESGSLLFEKVPFNLDEVCSNVFKLFENKAKEKQIRCNYYPDPNINFLICGDSVRLSQILSNLLSNAIKFTEKGAVSLAYTLKEVSGNVLSVVFTIKDTGIGIASDHLERIFDNFSQADASITRKYGGTGLGLAISKKLVEQQGGSICVESSTGQGSVFTVELPFEKSAHPRHVAPIAPLKIADMGQLNGMHVLVAEDNLVNILVLTPLLKKWGATFVVVNDGQEAITQVEKEDFDLIIMDLQMPVLDGRKATEAIRRLEDSHKRQIPIIAFTAEISTETHQDLLNTGFDGCLTKPFKPEVLFQTLKKYQLNNSSLLAP